MEEIIIKTEYIKLDQFLKFANLTENGADAKFLITEGYVKVNGECELRRGRKLYGGETIEILYDEQYFSLKVVKEWL